MHVTPSILVTGVTGTVGGALVEELVRRGSPVRGASRNPSRARTITPACREWVPFDLERPETFGAALDGIERVFLIARPGDDDPDRTAAPFLQAMVDAQVRHVVTLTAMGADRRDDVSLGRLERLVEDTGLPWTHLRPNWFMQVFATHPLLSAIRATGRIEVPAAHAPISWVDARDVAGVAAVTLTEPDHEARAYVLTGSEALDHAQVAGILGDVSGRALAYRPLDEETGRRAVLAAGLGARRAERLTRFYRLVRAGACAPVSGDIASVLGRPPTPFQRFATDHRHLWASGPSEQRSATVAPAPAHPPTARTPSLEEIS